MGPTSHTCRTSRAMGSVEETIRRIEAKEDYFQVLGLKRDATADESRARRPRAR